MRAIALATDKSAEGAANHILKQKGTAVDAVIAGMWAAAGARQGVLLAPAQMIVAGPGVGPRAFDGRARQPGKGAARPRGFVEGQPVPDAAYVAVPHSLAMLAFAYAHDGHLTLRRLLEPALDLAIAEGAKGREFVLRRIAISGVSALREPAILKALLEAGSSVQGGILTEADIVETRPESAPPEALGVRSASRVGRGIFTVPWMGADAPHRQQEVVVAVDARGVIAVLSFAPDDEGVPVPDLELKAPRDAIVVRRGVPRARPGAPLPCPAPILLATEAMQPVFGLGVQTAVGLVGSALAELWQRPATTAAALLRAAGDSVGASRGVGVVAALGPVGASSGGEARALVFPSGGSGSDVRAVDLDHDPADDLPDDDFDVRDDEELE